MIALGEAREIGPSRIPSLKIDDDEFHSGEYDISHYKRAH
jgi:hypothetical protein